MELITDIPILFIILICAVIGPMIAGAIARYIDKRNERKQSEHKN